MNTILLAEEKGHLKSKLNHVIRHFKSNPSHTSKDPQTQEHNKAHTYQEEDITRAVLNAVERFETFKHHHKDESIKGKC
jgi:hypothetical protein